MERRRAAGRSTDLPIHELIGCGLVGGAFSALTHPIDNVITTSQKPMPPGAKRDLLSVVGRMYAESGHRAFTRGFAIKIVDNALAPWFMTIFERHGRRREGECEVKRCS